VRVVGLLAILAITLTLAGCSTTDKKSSPEAKANPPSDRPFWQDPSAGPAAGPGAGPSGPSAANRTAPPQGIPGGILAGQVRDAYNRPPPPTFIQVVCTDDKQQGGAPIEIATDGQGYFTIQGLQPGRHYQLIARSKEGDRVLAGSVQAIPPNPKLLIRVSEDLVSANAKGTISPGKPLNNIASPERPAPDWTPPSGNNSGTPPLGVEILPPKGGRTPSSGGSPIISADPSRIADQGTVAAGTPIYINPPNAQPPGSTRGGSMASAEMTSTGSFCKLTGGNLENFSLQDLDGKSWEFRKDRRGRLVLLDFWGTWCMPCREAIWHLNSLNNVYRDYGLEVIGIAEERGDATDHARKVASLRQRQGINYRLLLGSGVDNDCPVRTEFGIRSYPTLVLLDDSGRILWRSEGLDEAKLRELQGIIRQQLRIRDYP
jgi:thiol-disulfide isomerase/thioredoxin